MLQVTAVSKSFGGLKAVDDVTLEVPEGGIVALIGPNGAGKTTLFAIISGFIRQDTGTISFSGRQIGGLPAHEICRLGLVRTFQVVQPFAGLTVRENIAVGAHLRVAERKAALAHAERIARLVGLPSSLDLPAHSLTVSGRKRLELARALATQPKLLLLDEVMAGLNPAEIGEIVPVIRAIRDSGVTVLLIEHVMQAVMSLSEHTWVLNNGRLIADGPPREVVSNPIVIEAYLGHGAAQRINSRAVHA
jgi:branched-chain amino acid transport system ATP-binding protein